MRALPPTALYLASSALLLAAARFSLRKEFFFDEAWRADYIGAASLVDRYGASDTPIPLAWLQLLRLTSRVLPDGFVALRLQSLFVSALAFVVIGVLVAQLLDEHVPRATAALTAGSSACLVVLLPAVTSVADYLNDYVFQALCTAVVVLLWWRYVVRPTRARGVVLLLSMTALPLCTIAGLFILPALVGDLAIRALHGRLLGLRTGELVGAVGATGGIAALLYVALYRQNVDEGLRTFWGGSTLHGTDGWTLAGRVLDRLWDNVLPTRTMLVHSSLRTNRVALALVLVLAVVGLWVIGRRWKQFPIALASAFAVSAVASVSVDWPVTPERVNLPYLWMLYVSIPVGLMWTLARVVRQPFALGAVAAGLVLVGFPQTIGYQVEPFARGLYGDLDVVAESPAAENIVVSYHFMSHFYAHDRLVNRGARNRSFRVVQERHGDESLFMDLDQRMRAAGWAHDVAVWCVMPFELGPDATRRACQLRLPGLRRAVAVTGSRANIVGWLPVAHAE